MIGRIIVPVSGTRQLENKLNHAIALAGRFGSRVDVLFLHGEVDPQSIERNPFFGTGWEAAEIRWAEEGPALSIVRTRVDRWLQTRAGTRGRGTVTGSWTNVTFLEIRGDYAQALQDHGRTSDLIVRAARAGHGAIRSGNQQALCDGKRPNGPRDPERVSAYGEYPDACAGCLGWRSAGKHDCRARNAYP
jgi:nucleotide-binding universal stress UspA family protein